MGGLGPLVMMLQLNIDNFTANLHSVEEQIQNTEDRLAGFSEIGGRIEGIGKSLTVGVTAPLAAAGTAGVKFATDLEEGMTKVSSIADTSSVSVDELKEAIINMSNESGQSTEILTEAMYEAISSGVETTDVIDFLKVAVMDAKGGFTDTATAVDGLTNVLNAYGLKTSEATTLSNQMLVAQNLGKTTFGELARSMGGVAPTANALNVSTEDLYASMAVLTANGIQTSEAATALKAAFSNVIKPSQQAADAAEALGLNFNAAEVKSKGWRGFLGEIKDKLQDLSPAYVENINKQAELTAKMNELESAGKKSSAEYKNLAKELKATKETGDLLAQGQDSQVTMFGTLFGSVEALNSVLTLTSESGMKLFDESLNEMATNTTAINDAYDTMNNTTQSKLEQTKEHIKNSLTQIGELLLPVVDKVVSGINSILTAFDSLSPAAKKIIIVIGGIVSAIGPLLIIIGKFMQAIVSIKTGIGVLQGAFGLLSGAFAGIAAPVMIAVGAIAAIIAIGVLLYKNWDTVCEKAGQLGEYISGVWNSICTWTSEAWGKVKQFVYDHVVGIMTVITGPIGGIIAYIVKNWDEVKQKTSEAWEKVKQFVYDHIVGIMSVITGPIGGIIAFVVKNWEEIKQKTGEIWEGVKKFVTETITSIPGAIGEKLNAIKTAIVEKWNSIKEVTGQAWENVKKFIGEKVSAIWPSIKDKISQIGTSISTSWESIKTATAQKFNAIKDAIFTAIGNIISNVPGKLNEVKNKFMSGFKFLSDLGKTAVTWGKDLIDGFVKGIKNSIGKVTNAVKGVGNKVKSYLHFSRPDEGPLREYEEWMPDFMSGLGSGIKDNTDLVMNPLKNLASSMNLSAQLKLQPSVEPSFESALASQSSGSYQIKKATAEKFNAIKDDIFTAIGNIISIVPGKLNEVKNKFMSGFSFLSNLGKTAVTWGTDLIDGFVEGIKNSISKVTNAVKDVGNKVKSYLHFSRPDEGPLREYEEWMPDFISGLGSGIKDNTDLVLNPIKNLASSMNLSAQLKLQPSVEPSFKGALASQSSNISTSWENIKTATAEKFNAIKDAIFSAIGNIISSVPGKLTEVKNKFMSGFKFLSDLGKTALTWGKDLIDGFVNGIKNSISKVTNAVKDVGDKVKSYLHFSRPDEGPLREYEEWMPDFMSGLGSGIKDNTDLVMNPLKNLASSMNLSAQLKLQPSVEPSFKGALASQSSGAYQINAPLLKVEHLHVRNDNDITNISRSIYNENMKVIRALGKRE